MRARLALRARCSLRSRCASAQLSGGNVVWVCVCLWLGSHACQVLQGGHAPTSHLPRLSHLLPTFQVGSSLALTNFRHGASPLRENTRSSRDLEGRSPSKTPQQRGFQPLCDPRISGHFARATYPSCGGDCVPSQNPGRKRPCGEPFLTRALRVTRTRLAI